MLRDKSYLTILTCLFLLILGACATKRDATATKEEIASHEDETARPANFYLADARWTTSSSDSLYELVEQIDLSPTGLSISALAPFEWNSAAQVFVASGLFTVFDPNLREVFTDENIYGGPILCDPVAPLVYVSTIDWLLVINLKTRKIVKRFPLEGTCKHLQTIENDQVLALFEQVENGELISKQYFFKNGALVKAENLIPGKRQEWIGVCPKPRIRRVPPCAGFSHPKPGKPRRADFSHWQRLYETLVQCGWKTFDHSRTGLC